MTHQMGRLNLCKTHKPVYVALVSAQRIAKRWRSVLDRQSALNAKALSEWTRNINLRHLYFINIEIQAKGGECGMCAYQTWSRSVGNYQKPSKYLELPSSIRADGLRHQVVGETPAAASVLVGVSG